MYSGPLLAPTLKPPHCRPITARPPFLGPVTADVMPFFGVLLLLRVIKARYVLRRYLTYSLLAVVRVS